MDCFSSISSVPVIAPDAGVARAAAAPAAAGLVTVAPFDDITAAPAAAVGCR